MQSWRPVRADHPVLEAGICRSNREYPAAPCSRMQAPASCDVFRLHHTYCRPAGFPNVCWPLGIVPAQRGAAIARAKS